MTNVHSPKLRPPSSLQQATLGISASPLGQVMEPGLLLILLLLLPGLCAVAAAEVVQTAPSAPVAAFGSAAGADQQRTPAVKHKIQR